MRLDVAVDILLVEPKQLARRVALVPYGKRDVAMLAAVTRRLISAISQTVPSDQYATYMRNLDAASYVVGVKRPGATTRDETNFGLWLSWSVLNALLGGCHETCMMCTLDTQTRRACPLRKALDTIPNEMADRDNGDCPYYTVI